MNEVYVVAVYDWTREYGGPEEGGWWYDTGELVDLAYATDDADDAWEVTRELSETYDLTTGDRWSGGSWRRATVVILGETVVDPKYADYLCHGESDAFFAEDGSVLPEYAYTVLEVPRYLPEGRPHYC